jgi:hypothetical protein
VLQREKPRTSHLQPQVAEDIRLWVRGIEQGSVSGLWIWGAPRIGTSYAGYAALYELGRLSDYAGQRATVIVAFDMYSDLRRLWDADSYARSSGNNAAWEVRDQIEAEVTFAWDSLAVMLDDWNTTTVPVEFFMKWIFPYIRRRISARQPLVIVSRYDPAITGGEQQFVLDEFVVTQVTHRGQDRNGTG